MSIDDWMRTELSWTVTVYAELLYRWLYIDNVWFFIELNWWSLQWNWINT